MPANRAWALAGVWAWQHERQSADVYCSSDQDEPERKQPAGFVAFVEQRISCLLNSAGVGLRSVRRSCALPARSLRSRSRDTAQDAGRGRRNQSADARRSWAIRKPTRASLNTKWRSACNLPCRNSRTSAKNRSQLGTCMVRKRKSPELSPTIACWRGAWPNAAFASHKSISAAGMCTTMLWECLPVLCQETDRGCYALVTDLKRRGLLDDTLVIWAGEFGRTVYSQGGLSQENYGRDHHPRCFTTWMAGGGVRPGITYGETDDYSYNVVKDPVHVRDFNATILHCLGIDHNKFSLQIPGLGSKAHQSCAGVCGSRDFGVSLATKAVSRQAWTGDKRPIVEALPFLRGKTSRAPGASRAAHIKAGCKQLNCAPILPEGVARGVACEISRGLGDLRADDPVGGPSH